jgi:poly-gamma-glutamate capsule biosynthesis protein CapA/YwtB (metallophosphatase superfamily)
VTATLSPLRMVLTGDSIITRNMRVFREPGYLDMVELIRSGDISITNAEMLFHNFDVAPTAVPGGSYMRAHPALIEDLKWMGFDLVACANNHAYDYGENGVLLNIRHLDAYGLAHAGTGANLSEARSPTYHDTPNGRVAVISVTMSGPQNLAAQHQWRDGPGRPGANMLRYTTTYTLEAEAFATMKKLRDDFGLKGFAAHGIDGARDPLDRRYAFADHSHGMSGAADTDTEFYMSDLHDQWQYPNPNGYRFKLGERASRDLIANRVDFDENIQRIADAKRQADYVVLTIHSHESGRTKDDPSNLLVHFAHAAIDAGADVVHGHGPHRDRGIEIYDGRPIFYSIGHFIFEGDTIEHMAFDNMVRSGISDPWQATVADFYDIRLGDERTGAWFGATTPWHYRDVIAVVDFSEGQLMGVALHPIELGYGSSRGQRGRPCLADGAIAAEVLQLFTGLSASFGTQIRVEKGVGHVVL